MIECDYNCGGDDGDAVVDPLQGLAKVRRDSPSQAP